MTDTYEYCCDQFVKGAQQEHYTELTREDLEWLIGEIRYAIHDGYVVDGFPSDKINVYSEAYWEAGDSILNYIQKRVDKRYGKCK